MTYIRYARSAAVGRLLHDPQLLPAADEGHGEIETSSHHSHSEHSDPGQAEWLPKVPLDC